MPKAPQNHPFSPFSSIFYSALLFLLFLPKMSTKTANITIEEAFTKDDLVEDLVVEAPIKGAKVTFPGGAEAQLGNRLEPAKTGQRPEVRWEGGGDKELFTVAMVDPDAPSRKKAQPHRAPFSEWLHWLVINVPGHNIAKGNALIDYMGPAPPKGSGERANFDIHEFALKNQFERPIAGNYFISQH